jgi:hypothetical protein
MKHNRTTFQELNITAGRWYLLQTNYDPWESAPFYDDRRTPGNICVKQWGQQAVGMYFLVSLRLNCSSDCKFPI